MGYFSKSFELDKSEMKLFSFLAVSCATVLADGPDDERAWANRPDFILGDIPKWWSNSNADKQIGHLKTNTEDYFDKYTVNGTKRAQNTGAKMKAMLDKTRDMMTANKDECYPNDGRKRRSGGDDNIRWTLQNQSHWQDMNTLFTKYASWIRNTLQSSCPKQAQRLLKRMNRMRAIWYWQVCRDDAEIESGSQCDWWGRHDEHPRKRGWINKYYGKNVSQTYIVNGCQGPAELVCPYGGKIEIVSSKYARDKKWTCAKNATGETATNCEGTDTSAASKAACNGAEQCTFNSNLESSCEGVDSYETVNYKCN